MTLEDFKVGNFEYKDGKGRFIIIYDGSRVNPYTAEVVLRGIVEDKIKTLPADKEFIGNSAEIHRYNNFDYTREVRMFVTFKYRQLSLSETTNKEESERINHFVNNLELIRQ